MLYTWVSSFVGASVGALYAMCVGFKVFLYVPMLYAWVLRLFPDLHVIRVVLSFVGASAELSMLCAWVFKVIFRSARYTHGLQGNLLTADLHR